MQRLLRLLLITSPYWLGLFPSTAQSADRRCATRLSIALLGESPTEDLLTAATPRTHAPAMLTSPEFVERFARFANAEMNETPGVNSAEDAVYHLVKHILSNRQRWIDVFIGRYNIQTSEEGSVRVIPDPNGLGYFRSQAWQQRYAGNEDEGIRLNSVYRMMQNAIGIELKAATTAPDTDTSALGRQSAACSGCHYDQWFALDKNAAVLAKVQRNRNGEFRGFDQNSVTATEVLDGKFATNDRDFVHLLVGSNDHHHFACQLAFKFLTGRDETTCESATITNCVDTFKSSGYIQDALRTVINSDDFCKI